MANRNLPITLPWKRPEKGVSAAELGASFRVEQRDDGWHCTVKVGRRAEVLATGLRRLRDAQCRAEAHAATMPEVAAALASARDETKKAATKGRAVPSTRTATMPNVLEDVRIDAPALSFERVSDGCICGKIESGTWVASPKGTVSVPPGTDDVTAQAICRVATNHYAAQSSEVRSKPAKPATKGAASQRAASAVAEADAKAAEPKHAGEDKRGKGKRKGKRGASKAAARTAAKTAARAAKAAAKGPARKAGDASAKDAPRKAGDAPAAKTAAKAATRKKPAPAAKTAAKAATRKAPAPATKTAAKAATRKAPAAKAPAKEETVSKKSGKAATKGETCGCVTWSEMEAGTTRGEAKHGTFTIEAEGKKHALYFYDADGQSRHLQSGEAGKLRKVAEEMAARGQPVPRPASAVDDAALMRAFMGGAMEDDK